MTWAYLRSALYVNDPPGRKRARRFKATPVRTAASNASKLGPALNPAALLN